MAALVFVPIIVMLAFIIRQRWIRRQLEGRAASEKLTNEASLSSLNAIDQPNTAGMMSGGGKLHSDIPVTEMISPSPLSITDGSRRTSQLPLPAAAQTAAGGAPPHLPAP